MTIAWGTNPAVLADDTSRVSDVRHDAWHPARHRFRDGVRKSFGSGRRDQQIKRVIDAPHVGSFSCPDESLTQMQLRTESDHLVSIGTRPGAHAHKSHVGL